MHRQFQNLSDFVSVHREVEDKKAVTYKVALERFGRKREVEFWSLVSQIEGLLEQASEASKSSPITPPFQYTRLETFDHPCEECSDNKYPCYTVPKKLGKRTSKKCMLCFVRKKQCTSRCQFKGYSVLFLF